MPTHPCIYCGNDASGAKQGAHVFPEAVVQNDVILPVGLMCDECNGYFGNTLDAVLAWHPGIAWTIQNLGLPGKRGMRQRVANVASRRPEAFFEVEIAPLEVETSQDGKPVIVMKTLLDPRFDLLRFRRCLHMVALNIVALRDGAQVAVDPAYDPVRRYVREPRPKESWPFAVWFNTRAPAGDISLDIHSPSDFGSLVTLRIFRYSFFVELRGTGRFEAWAREQQLPGLEFIGPGKRYPASPREQDVDPMKRYKLKVNGPKPIGAD